MVEVGGYYYLSAQEIESVFCVKGSADYPYKLTVIMKSGKDYSVCYEKETDRNEEKRRVLNAIETERRRDAETILNKLYLINLAGAGVVAGNGKIRDEKRRVCAGLLGVATGNRGKGAGNFAFCCCHCESLLFCVVFCVGGFVYP